METTEEVKSFEQICEATGLVASEEIPFAEPKNGRQKAVNAAAKLFIIAEFYNQGWVPDWYNWNEYKYYPWFDLSPEKSDEDGPAGGSGFSVGACDHAFSHSYVGARLVFKSRKIAEFVGKNYLDIYRDFMVIE